MLIQGQIKEADYVASLFLHMRPRPIFAVIYLLFLGLVIWALIYIHFFILLAGFFIYLVGTYAFYIPFKARRNFRQYKAISEPSTIEVREDGLFFKRTNGEGLVPWSHIIKWRNNKKFALLYPTGNIFYAIPSHFFVSSEEFQAFLTILEGKIGKST